MIVKSLKKIIFLVTVAQLSGCVTQNFENNVPVVENSTSNKELAMTRISLGLGYLDMGNNSQAKFNLEKAKKFAPELVEVHAAFAHYFEKVGEDELTVESYEKALKINPVHANTLNNYGVYLCRQLEFDAAEVQFLKAIAVPSYLLVSESYENLAQCQLDNDDFAKSEYYLLKAIKHSPNRETALLAMARLQYAMGNYREAGRYETKFEKSTRRFKSSSLALAVKIYQKMGNRKTSDNYGAMLVKMFPQSWEAKQYLLNGLERIEADELADRYIAKSSQLNDKKKKKRTVIWTPTSKPMPQEEAVETPVTPPSADREKDEDYQLSSGDESINDEQAVDFLPGLQEETTKEQPKQKEEVSLKGDVNNALDKDVESEDESLTIVVGEIIPTPVHIVAKGENMFGISMRYNTQMKAILKWNNLPDASNIMPGDKLYVADPDVVLRK
jgi:type IV pilus assembly protein PilF